jgi:hypothetical protein
MRYKDLDKVRVAKEKAAADKGTGNVVASASRLHRA